LDRVLRRRSQLGFFEATIVDAGSLVVPSISIYEVFKRLLREPNGEEAALHVVAAMQRGRVANLDAELALDAAKTSFETKRPMANSILLATTRAYGATL
jgi:hypothetical protein